MILAYRRLPTGPARALLGDGRLLHLALLQLLDGGETHPRAPYSSGAEVAVADGGFIADLHVGVPPAGARTIAAAVAIALVIILAYRRLPTDPACALGEGRLLHPSLLQLLDGGEAHPRSPYSSGAEVAVADVGLLADLPPSVPPARA